MAWNEGPLLGFDLETTGVNPCKDLPVQVALVRWDRCAIACRNVFLVDPGCEIPAAAEAVHGISTRKARREGCRLEEAVAILHSVLQKAQADRLPVVAMNASFDITIATTLFRNFGLKPIAWVALVDPLVIDRQMDRYRSGKRRLDALCRVYDVILASPHDAGSDADATVAIARTIAERYPELAGYEIDELTRCEAEWHHAWALEYDSWCRANGKGGLSPEEFHWPLREAALEPHFAA
ncbi:MAG: exonuclease domain-containing protein [Acidimicrobiales bacterium]|jgi:DNA polymerase-3 subunit epsilon